MTKTTKTATIVFVFAALFMGNVLVSAQNVSAQNAILPGALTATCINNNTAVRLDWTSGVNANSNSIEKGDLYPNDPNRFWDFIFQDQSLTARTFVDGNITPGIEYTYRIKYAPAVPSNEVRIRCGNDVPPPPPPALIFPGTLTAVCVNNNTAVRLDWTSGVNANSNSIEKGDLYPNDPNRFWGFILQDPSLSIRTFTDTNIISGTSYTYRIKYAPAVPSNEVTITCATAVQQQPTVTLTANPSVINQGNSSLLTWSSQNATTCFAAGGWGGTKNLSGNESVTPSITTIYTIVCMNAQGQSANAQATVTVTPQNIQTPTLTLYASPTFIYQGQNSVLTWNSQNTVSCNASGGWSGTKSLSGSETVFPQFTTTYSMTCIGTNNQSVTQQATVVVNQQQQQLQPSVTLNANPSFVSQGQSATLSWYSSNANSCNASGGWSGNKNLSGSEVVYPSFTTTYTITCVNNYGLATDSKTVTVNNNNVISGNVQVTKTVRNITLNQYGFSNSVEAQGSDVLEFEIRVRNNDYNYGYNYGYNYNYGGTMTVRDILPQELFYMSGSTTVDGYAVSDGITSGGITVNNVIPGQEKVIRFRTTLYASTGDRTIVNQAIATTNNGFAQSGFANIIIRNRGQVPGVSDIVTGPENPVLWVLGLGFLATLAMHLFIFRKRGYSAPVLTRLVPSFAYGTPTNTVLARKTNEEVRKQTFYNERLNELLTDIRARESRPDTDALSG